MICLRFVYTTMSSDLCTEVDACFSKVKLKWNKLVGVTTDGYPSLTEKNVCLLKHMQDQVTARNQKQKLVFLHCIIHQEVLGKSVVKICYIANAGIKIVNFVMTRALNH